METYYHSNPKIEEWAGQIIEKILTVCILSGTDSDSNTEYQKGCQLIAKMTALLQGFSSIPAEYLADGLKQIIEQQLPDPRVISNFSAFQDTMNGMIKEGMLTVVGELEIEPVQLDVIEAQPALALVHHENAKADRLIDSANQIAECEQITDNKYINGETKRLNQTQLHRERFKNLLPYLFPKETIHWDVTILGQTFLAQLGDILIYCADMDQRFNQEIYFKDGWKVMIIQEEELAYPRRLERELKKLMRIGNKIK